MTSTAASTTRLPLSGNAALAAGALIQVVVGLEFLLAGVSKLLDADFAEHFATFVAASPGSHVGPLSPILQGLVLPHAWFAARLTTFAEIGAGLVLSLSSVEVARRRFSGRIGAQHAYEPAVALLSAAAALTAAALSAGIYLVEGGGLPTVAADNAFGSPIAVEFLLASLGLGIAWLELGRFRALRARRREGVGQRRAPRVRRTYRFSFGQPRRTSLSAS